MAIVKFISDQDCHIFIDKENVGKVTADSLLKAVLEVGGYLIEVKDDEGRILKKYNLEIKTTDNQILQDVSGTSPSTDEVLDLLKNDPTVVFHCGRAKFCLDGKYGYVNKKFEVVIPAIYSFANDFVNNKAFVVRDFPEGRKTTMIDEDGNMFFNQWYDYIGSGEKTVLLKNEETFYVLSKVDYSIVNQYLDAKYDGKGVLIPVHKHIGVDDMYGYIDKTGTEVIPLIYDFAGNFRENNLATVKRFGEYNAVDLDGNLYRYGIHSYKSKRETEILSKEESLDRGFSGCIKTGDYWGLYSDEKSCWDRIIYNSDSYLVYRKNGTCNIVIKRKEYFEFGYLNIVDEKSISIEADYIDLAFSWDGRPTSEFRFLKYLIIRKNWKYGIIDLEKNTILPINFDFVEPIDAHVNDNPDGPAFSAELAIVWQCNKCSLFSMEKREFLMPFEFEDIIVNENFDNCLNPIMDSSFLMKKNGKYGLIANDYKTVILPFEHDYIDYDVVNDYNERCERVILTKKGRMGMIQKYHYYNEGMDRWEDVNVQLDEEYDECVFLEDKNSKAKLLDVAVRKANRWAIVNCHNGNVNVKDLLFIYESLDEIDGVRRGLIVNMPVTSPKSPIKGIRF